MSASERFHELLRRRAAGGGHDDGARLALAIEGGGMRGAVSAGMVIAIHELGLTGAFDAVYGASAGALNGVWLLSGNPADGLRPYADPGLIRQYIRRSNVIRGRPVVDTRHLVEHLYEHELPLRFDTVLADRVRFHPLATDVETGRAVDLGPAIRDRDSLKLALRATTALPLLAGPPVVIAGRAAAQHLPYGVRVAHALSDSSAARNLGGISVGRRLARSTNTCTNQPSAASSPAPRSRSAIS